MTPDPFQDRTILVTGATRGLGQCLSHALIARGAEVIAVARDRGALDRLRAETSARLHPIVVDLSRAEAIDRLVEQLGGKTLTGLINNAGLQHEMRLKDTGPQTLAQTEAEIAVNLSAPIRLTTGLLPQLARTPAGFVCNITSGLALAPKQSAPVYCATKAGLRSFTRALRYQCARDCPGVLINEVLPALIDTDMTAGRDIPSDSPETVAEAILNSIARRREETWIGKARLLRRLYGLSPALVARILK